MNTLKYSLEYGCYPIWHYDSTGELIDNDLPQELRQDTELDTLLLKVQEIFDSLYINTPHEFSSHGFATEEARQEFVSLLLSSVSLLNDRYGDDYHIVCPYNNESFSTSE